jgi:hypothetical protein
VFYALSQRLDGTDDLMPRDDGIVHVRKLRIEDMQVGATHRARLDTDANLPRPRLGIGALFECQRLPTASQYHRKHR